MKEDQVVHFDPVLHRAFKTQCVMAGVSMRVMLGGIVADWLADAQNDGGESKYMVVCEIPDLTSRMLSLICETSDATKAEAQLEKGSRERTGREVLLVKVLKTETRPYL